MLTVKVGGTQVSSCQFIFQNHKKIRPEFHVRCLVDSRENKSLFASPPSIIWRCTPPPLARFIPPLRGGINRFCNVRAYHLPRGVLYYWPIFFILPSWLHNIVQTTTHDDGFLLCRAESPSLTFNLVGRWLRLAKRVADTLPARGHASVYCFLPRRPFAHEQTTSHFSARRCSSRTQPNPRRPQSLSSPRQRRSMSTPTGKPSRPGASSKSLLRLKSLSVLLSPRWFQRRYRAGWTRLSVGGKKKRAAALAAKASGCPPVALPRGGSAPAPRHRQPRKPRHNNQTAHGRDREEEDGTVTAGSGAEQWWWW